MARQCESCFLLWDTLTDPLSWIRSVQYIDFSSLQFAASNMPPVKRQLESLLFRTQGWGCRFTESRTGWPPPLGGQAGRVGVTEPGGEGSGETLLWPFSTYLKGAVQKRWGGPLSELRYQYAGALEASSVKRLGFFKGMWKKWGSYWHFWRSSWTQLATQNLCPAGFKQLNKLMESCTVYKDKRVYGFCRTYGLCLYILLLELHEILICR